VAEWWALLEIFLLAAGSMFWPLLLVVVALALRTPQALRILAWFWAGGMLTSVSVGAAIVFALDGTARTSGSTRPSAPSIDVVVGSLALLAAIVLHRVGARAARRRTQPEPPKRKTRTSRWVEHLVESGGPLAFVGGIVATILPAPLAIIAMADIAELDYSVTETVLVIVAFYLVMFTFVEVPMIGYVVSPDRTEEKAAAFNAWLERNLVRLGVWALTIFGAAEIIRGIVTALR
jgi:Sap-like sulfolipid-1-addressing protein